MGRLGIQLDNLAEFARSLGPFDNVKLDGVMTHFAAADSDTPDYTERQIRAMKWRSKFCAISGSILPGGIWPTARDSCVSAIARQSGARGRRDVRSHAGRSVAEIEPFELRPVMSLHSRVMMLKTVPRGTPLGYGRTFTTARESRVATLPIGYADGLRRLHSNNGRVLTRGHFAPVVGRVSMDLTIIDVTDVPGVELGDEVTLIGGQNGLRITAEDLAERIGTISYEIVTGISARVPRVYVKLDARPPRMF